MATWSMDLDNVGACSRYSSLIFVPFGYLSAHTSPEAHGVPYLFILSTKAKHTHTVYLTFNRDAHHPRKKKQVLSTWNGLHLPSLEEKKIYEVEATELLQGTLSAVSVTPKEMKVADEEGSHSILDSISSREGFPSSFFTLLLFFYLYSLVRECGFLGSDMGRMISTLMVNWAGLSFLYI